MWYSNFAHLGLVCENTAFVEGVGYEPVGENCIDLYHLFYTSNYEFM